MARMAEWRDRLAVMRETSRIYKIRARNDEEAWALLMKNPTGRAA